MKNYRKWRFPLSVGPEHNCRASVFPTLAMSLDRAPGDPRPAKFFDELEGAIAAQLSLAPVPMKIPLAQMTLVKAISEK